MKMTMSVTGEAIMSLARNMMLSDQPDSAWRLLDSSLLGDREVLRSKTVEILEGTTEILGDSTKGLRFRSQKARAYQRELEKLYVGRTIIDRIACRPVAVALPPDYLSGGSFTYSFVQRRLGPGEKARRVGSRWIVFEVCGAAPFWRPRRNEAEAVADREELLGELPQREISEADDRARRDREAREAREEAEMLEDERIRAHDEQIEKYRALIIERAGSNTFELALSDGRVLTVPRAPFEQWAFGRAKQREQATPWTPVCPSGLKLPFDDEWHSDWLLGAGLDLRSYYDDRPVADAAMEAAAKLVSFEVFVVSAGPKITGVVGRDIAILPDLSVKHQGAFLKAKGVIAETGGQLAHLAKVGREVGIPVVVVPGARQRYADGTKVTIDTAKGRVRRA